MIDAALAIIDAYKTVANQNIIVVDLVTFMSKWYWKYKQIQPDTEGKMFCGYGPLTWKEGDRNSDVVYDVTFQPTDDWKFIVLMPICTWQELDKLLEAVAIPPWSRFK